MNSHEWNDFRVYWQEKLDRGKGDDLYAYKEHNWGGYEFKTAEGTGKKYYTKKEMLGNLYSDEIERVPCHYVFESLIILADGTLSLCPPDFLEGQFELGAVPNQTPIEAFNSLAYKKMRKLHLDENKNDIELCKTCTVLYGNATRDWTWFETANTLTDRENTDNYFKPEAVGKI